MNDFEIYVTVILVIIGLVGYNIRDKSYRAPFNSLKRRGELTGFDGLDHTWSDSERIVSGHAVVGSVHGATIRRLKLLGEMVPEERFSDDEKGFKRNIRYGQQAMVPLVTFLFHLFAKYVLFP